MIVLGINAYHADSAAALVVDEAVVAAAEEERFRRIKHWAGFPSEAIRYCLAEAGVSLGDVQCVAVNTDPSVGRWARVRYGLSHLPSLSLVRDKLLTRRRRLSVGDELRRLDPLAHFEDDRVVHVEHHLAHLASAYFASGFRDAAVVSVDGFGDFASAAWGIGAGPSVHVKGRVGFPHSLGIFYQAMTQYLGFPHYGDEYKVMGLAPYGEPAFVDALRNLVRTNGAPGFELDTRYFRHHRERIAFDWDDGVPVFASLYSRELERLLGPARLPDEPISQRHKDLARSAQVVFEDVYLEMLRSLATRSRTRNLAIAGGCAQNSVANGKITRETPFENVYVAAAGYDAGGAVGAALWAACQGEEYAKPLRHAYLGPQFSREQIETVLRANAAEIEAGGCTVELVEDEQAMFDRTVDVMLDGGIVGWFQGRMEWGPRALGNRSILADPRRNDIKDILNRKIKRRESFRPFAPSILRERVLDWFEVDGDVPFMSHVFPIRAEKRALIPAVTHVDGTGRLQTVTRDANPRYYGLIERFGERTGVPMVLNTSFNENEPIVCKPQEALDCFLRTKMDVLVLGDFFLRREGGTG